MLLKTEYWHIDIVNEENHFIYDPNTESDVLHDPFHVMVGAIERPTTGQITTTVPDIIWEYETEPRMILSCGHAISNISSFRYADNNYRIYGSYLMKFD